MKILCEPIQLGKQASAETQQLRALLAEFSSVNYDPIMQDTLNYRQLSTVLGYISIDVITMYENSVTQRFREYVERFVNVSLQKRERLKGMKENTQHTTEHKNNLIDALCRDLCKVKSDIFCLNSPKTSDVKYHAWIDALAARNIVGIDLNMGDLLYCMDSDQRDQTKF